MPGVKQLSSYSIDHILNEQGLKELAMAEAGTRKALKAEHIFTQDDRNRRAYEQCEAAIRDYESIITPARVLIS